MLYSPNLAFRLLGFAGAPRVRYEMYPQQLSVLGTGRPFVIDLARRQSSIAQRTRQLAGEVARVAGEICLVPAPTGQEHDRAHFVADLFERRRYRAEVTADPNVLVTRPGAGAGLILLSAHLDTVFPLETELFVRAEGHRLRGPGIGDNSLGLAAAIGLFDLLDTLEVETSADIVLVADAGEEGLGNLRGMRSAVEHFGEEISAVIAIEGHNLGRITTGGAGSLRLRVLVTGPGGHSWGAWGQPSAIHALGDILSAWNRIKLPERPRTTFNVGTVNGGTSVNTIASAAEAVVDLRSVDPLALERLAREVRDLALAAERPGISITLETLGERPAGSISSSHPLVRVARLAAREAGVRADLDISSTSANVPLALGIPAVCVGITVGGRGHSIDEYIDVRQIPRGLHQLTNLVMHTDDLIRNGAIGQGGANG